MQGYKKLLLTAGLVALLTPAMGQNTNSPYSRYGYGVLSDQAIGASKGMGGISYGVRGLSSNPGNPASYSSVDSLTFIFDMGINYSKTKLSEGANSKSNDNGGLEYLSFQLSLAKKLGLSFGILPYSRVGYQYGNTYTNSTGLASAETYSGSGGFSQVYAGLGYELIKGLSVGANASYLFGKSEYNKTLAFNLSGAYMSNKYTQLKLEVLKVDLGMQYVLPVNSKNELVLGAVFSPKINNTGRIERQNTQISSSSTIVEADTAVFTGNRANADLPMTVGAGFTWNHNNKLTIGADVTYKQWSKVKYSSNMEDGMTDANRFKDSWRMNAGLEYIIAPNERSILKRLKWRGGVNASNSYLNVTNKSNQVGGFDSYGATFGIGIPIRDSKFSPRTSYININFEYSTLKPNISNMVKEEFFGISLNVNINELWFFKRKLQ